MHESWIKFIQNDKVPPEPIKPTKEEANSPKKKQIRKKKAPKKDKGQKRTPRIS
jgi:hypothetical protein